MAPFFSFNLFFVFSFLGWIVLGLVRRSRNLVNITLFILILLYPTIKRYKIKKKLYDSTSFAWFTTNKKLKSLFSPIGLIGNAKIRLSEIWQRMRFVHSWHGRCVARFMKVSEIWQRMRPTRLCRESPKKTKTKFCIQIFSPSKLYMKLKTDILPRALWNSCEEIFRIENTKFILLKTLKFLMAFAM